MLSTSQVVIDEYGFPETRVYNGSWGVDTKFFSPISTNETYILSAGTASRDYRTLIEAVKGLPCCLRIAADSAWFKEIMNLDGIKVPDNVNIFSAGNYKNLRDEYSHAKFVVVPLKNVPYAAGYAVISEAMAMGKAVICTATPCPSDFIVDGTTGIYVEAGNIGALRTAISYLLHNPEVARLMGDKGRERIERCGSLRVYSDRIAEIVSDASITGPIIRAQ